MRRQPRHQHYVTLIASLLEASEPVSFYDALTLVRQLRGQDPANVVVAALIELHDAEHATNGARDVLANYLRATASRQENQRGIAARPVTLKDRGKTARAIVGSRLELRLDERKAMGFRWDVTEHRGGGQVVRSRQSNEFPSTAIFDVVLNRTGTFEFEMCEMPPRHGAPDQSEKPREFTLRIFVEPKPAPPPKTSTE